MEIPQDGALAHGDACGSLDTKLGQEVFMVAAVSGQEQESKILSSLSPTSQKRERKKNPRYSDYEVEEKSETTGPKQKRGGRPPKKTSVAPDSLQPALHCGSTAAEPLEAGDQSPEPQSPPKKRRGRPPKKKPISQQRNDWDKKATAPSDGGDQDTRAQAPPKEPALKPPDITPKGRRKTPARKKPARKTQAEELSAAGDQEASPEQRPVETPKRKYLKKKKMTGPPLETAPVLPKETEETPAGPHPETNLGGRPRRSAAKTALKYLHSLAQESLSGPEASDSRSGSPDSLSDRAGPRRGAAATRCKKRRRLDCDDFEGDEDFLPGGGDEEMLDDMEEEEEEEEEGLELELEPTTQYYNKSNILHRRVFGVAANGISNAMMRPALDAYAANKKFREEHHSDVVFPEWLPSAGDWTLVPSSELEKYLPQELQSAAFQVSREGISNTETPQRLNRFQVCPPHPERLDLTLFVGGPVWALEWCPLPDGAPAHHQYLALACHQGMDQQHVFNQMYAGRGLVQLWDLGGLGYGSRPEAGPASLAYGLGQDKGFIWQLKWCPAGAWDPPTASREAPFLPRLGLLAVAVSTGVVSIYSLPQPQALSGRPSEGDGHGPLVYQAREVLTLKLGASKAPHCDRSGQVLSMDWLPEKPHNVMAVGFYDGTVGLWDLSSCSSLLRVCDPAHGPTLLPYRCFVAHDNAVRALCFCPASSQVMATGGNDRMVKLWDLKRLYQPINVQKRNLTTEVCWPLASPGTFHSQEISYASRGLTGAYYNDLGYRNARSVFITPRTGTVWSLSFSDWCNSLVTGDGLGEVIFALLPDFNCTNPSLRRTVERRFPIFFTDMVHYDAEEKRSQERRGGAGGRGKGVSSSGRLNNNKRCEEDVASGDDGESPAAAPESQSYRAAVERYYLHYSDSNLRSFKNYKRRAPWKRMKQTEVKTDLDLDRMPLAALHKVRFNPNMRCHAWVASGGQAGLLRVHCLHNMTGPHSNTQDPGARGGGRGAEDQQH